MILPKVLNTSYPINKNAPLNRGLIFCANFQSIAYCPGDMIRKYTTSSIGTLTTSGLHPPCPNFRVSKKFNGSANYITVNNSAGLNGLTSHSIAAWVRWSGTQNAGGYGFPGIFCGRQKDGSFTSHSFYLTGTNPATSALRYCRAGIPNLGSASVSGSTSVGDNTWRFVVATGNGTDTRVYLDGKLDGTAAIGQAIGDDYTIKLNIGGNNGGIASYLIGNIAEFRVYNRTLTAHDVAELYNASRTGYYQELNYIDRKWFINDGYTPPPILPSYPIFTSFIN